MGAELNTQNINSIKEAKVSERNTVTEAKPEVQETSSTEIVKADESLKYGVGKKQPPAPDKKPEQEIVDASATKLANERSKPYLSRTGSQYLDAIIAKSSNTSERIASIVNQAIENSDNPAADSAWTMQKAVPVDAYKKLTMAA